MLAHLDVGNVGGVYADGGLHHHLDEVVGWDALGALFVYAGGVFDDELTAGCLDEFDGTALGGSYDLYVSEDVVNARVCVGCLWLQLLECDWGYISMRRSPESCR